MGDDDTFFGLGSGDNSGGDRTILKPTPGLRSRGGAPQPAAPPPTTNTGMLPRVDGTDANPLAAAAGPLLSLAGRLTNTVSHPDPSSLFRHVTQEVQTFEAAARSAGVPNDALLTARYALCTLVDEVVLNTPWGSQSSWASQTLLTLFHKEAWGGEKFFQVLERLLQQPAANLDLLELCYLCLSMGLEGQYRVHQNSRTELDSIRSNVYQTLRQHRGLRENDLSPHWEGVEDTRSPLSRAVPLWVVAAVAVGLGLSIYLGFLWSLNSASDTVATEIAALGRNLPPLVERRGYVPPPRELTLADLLQPELDQGTLELVVGPGSETVRLRALFPSGSADVSGQGQQLLAALAAALKQLPGQVLITGHTDNVPSRSVRFPSNWHLSKSRAEAVTQLLSVPLGEDRLISEARADSEPLEPNSTPANRAINRRVEITLYNAPGRE